VKSRNLGNRRLFEPAVNYIVDIVVFAQEVRQVGLLRQVMSGQRFLLPVELLRTALAGQVEYYLDLWGELVERATLP